MHHTQNFVRKWGILQRRTAEPYLDSSLSTFLYDLDCRFHGLDSEWVYRAFRVQKQVLHVHHHQCRGLAVDGNPGLLRSFRRRKSPCCCRTPRQIVCLVSSGIVPFLSRWTESNGWAHGALVLDLECASKGRVEGEEVRPILSQEPTGISRV